MRELTTLSSLNNIEEITAALQSLSHETRLSIILRLQNRDMKVSDLAAELKLSQPLLSQHLSKLKEAGFVSVSSDGKNRIYTPNKHAITYFVTRLRLLVSE